MIVESHENWRWIPYYSWGIRSTREKVRTYVYLRIGYWDIKLFTSPWLPRIIL